MRISYDSGVDALYIRLLDGEYQCRTLRLTDEISLNIGPGEELVGIEVLDAKAVFGKTVIAERGGRGAAAVELAHQIVADARRNNL
ncbi:MAG: hypothetical protein DMG24_20740 [Acidobacteria bacterium]|nr:MAG: hypothetical protein DMG24_20740 [Acidobacteriota bacterium]